MKKKIVIIGANEFQNPLILKAKSLGYETHVFAWKNGDIGETTADYFYPISIIEKEQILTICKAIKPNAITSIGSDLAVLTVTYLASKLNLNGNDYNDSIIQTNKYEMRKSLMAAGIKVPKFQKVASYEEITDFTFPKVVKPTDRSGSRAIALVKNKKELKKAIKNSISNSFENCAIVEDVILGDREYSCETISFKGKHHVLAVTKKYTTGFPKCIETGHIQPSDLSENEMQNLLNLIPKALDSLHIKNGPSHLEFIVGNNSEINIVEIGARMGGDCIGSHLVELSTGYDYLKMTIDVALNKEPDFTENKKYRYAFIKFILNQNDLDKVNVINKKYSELLIENSVIGNINHEVVDSSTRFGYYIYATNDKKILDEIVNEVKLYE